MPDISMCANYNCPLKSKCYRYLAKPNDYGYQAYADFDIKDKTCDGFWDATGRQTDSLEDADKRNTKLYNAWHKTQGEKNEMEKI